MPVLRKSDLFVEISNIQTHMEPRSATGGGGCAMGRVGNSLLYHMILNHGI